MLQNQSFGRLKKNGLKSIDTKRGETIDDGRRRMKVGPLGPVQSLSFARRLGGGHGEVGGRHRDGHGQLGRWRERGALAGEARLGAPHSRLLVKEGLQRLALLLRGRGVHDRQVRIASLSWIDCAGIIESEDSRGCISHSRSSPLTPPPPPQKPPPSTVAPLSSANKKKACIAGKDVRADLFSRISVGL
jgi:hypothetical protein